MFQRDRPLTRLSIERLDPTYLLPRAGTTTALFTRTVTVIGCGAVGSHVANHLAALGVGRLRLIDHDILTSANIHRHTLGATYLGINKAAGIAVALGQHYPHLTVEHRTTTIDTVLRNEPKFITDADLVVIAIGDPTEELRLNALLGPHLRRLHVWVEPLGIGGHVLATGVAPGSGCYQCIYEEDSTLGLINLASFAAPGHIFQRTMGGCSGQFVPFAALDADRIAIEATRLVAQILSGEEQENVLISVREDERAFCAEGYTLAPRVRQVAVGTRCRETRHARIDCPVCSVWQQ